MRVVGIDGDYPLDRPGLVYGATGVADDWEDIRLVLLEAFRLTQQTLSIEEPVVYVIANDDLLGRNGPGSAAVAAALLSGARTAALELAKSGVPVNVIAIDDEVDGELVREWVLRLLEDDGPSGELIHLGFGHIGKALA